MVEGQEVEAVVLYDSLISDMSTQGYWDAAGRRNCSSSDARSVGESTFTRAVLPLLLELVGSMGTRQRQGHAPDVFGGAP